MKTIIWLFVALTLACAEPPPTIASQCSGDSTCTACKSCTKCKHCTIWKGKCKTCSKLKPKPKDSTHAAPRKAKQNNNPT